MRASGNAERFRLAFFSISGDKYGDGDGRRERKGSTNVE